MIKLKITDKNGYEYKLEDETGHIYNINLDFLDIQEKPKSGDFICFSNELLNPKYDGYSKSYTFGDLKSQYGKSNISIEDIDVIKVIIEEKEIYLKRLYG